MKNMRTATLCAACYLLVLMQGANAQQATVTSIGDYDCGEWFTKKQPARTWLLGYLSGLAAGDSQAKVDVLDRLNSADQAYFWMDNYCKANPLKNISSGAIQLYFEVEGKR
jgi:hypothetical protein